MQTHRERCDAEQLGTMETESSYTKALSKVDRTKIPCYNPFLRLNTLQRCFKREWIKDVYERREVCGEYHNLFPVLRENKALFVQYTRMSVGTFDYVLSKVEQSLQKKHPNWRKPISAEERDL